MEEGVLELHVQEEQVHLLTAAEVHLLMAEAVDLLKVEVAHL